MKKKIAIIIFIITLIFIFFPLTAGYAKTVETQSSNPVVKEYIGFSETVEEDYEIIFPNDFELCAQRSNEIMKIENKEFKLDEYMRLINEYRELLEPPILLEDMFTENEIYLICRCVETEVYQQDFSSKVNVAAVIFNRLASELFPNSIDAIIIENQFAFWRTDISEDTYRAVEYAWLFGGDCEDALWFHSYITPCDFYGEYSGYTDDAGHHFYH